MKDEETQLLRTLGGRVKWARTVRGLTQAELADKAGVSQSAIGNLETGTRKKPREMVAIARALRANVGWLDTGRGDWEDTAAPEELSDAQRALLADFHAMLEDDQRGFAEEIARRAAQMRAHVARVTGKTTKAREPEPTAGEEAFTASDARDLQNVRIDSYVSEPVHKERKAPAKDKGGA